MIQVVVSIQRPRINRNEMVKEESLVRIKLSCGNIELLRQIGDHIDISGTYSYHTSEKGCFLDVISHRYGDKFTYEDEKEWYERCGKIKEQIISLGYENVEIEYYE